MLNSFLKALATGDNIRDFKHASRTFVDGNFRLSPKHKFLFHVVFQVNPGLGFTFSGSENTEASFLVKNVELPKYSFELVEHNQYNRKRYHHNRINYNPVTITFHDDNSDVIRNMWYAYYAYYNNDPQYESAGTYSYKDTYSPMLSRAQQWGLDRNTDQFFRAIKIYSLYQKKYTEYWLVNPYIETFDHDSHDYADAAGVLEHRMTVRFETVKYKSGLIAGDGPAGFGTTHYDTAPSPLTPQGGGTTSILGPGGIVDAVGSIGSDLAGGNIAGAVVTGLRGAKNLKGANLKSMLKSELTGAAMNALRGKNPIGDFSFPNSKSTGGNPLPNVPKVNAIPGGSNQIPSASQSVFSNGGPVQIGPLADKLQSFVGGAGAKLQSLTNNLGGMTGQLNQNVPSSLQSLFGPGLNNISTHVNSAEFQTRFNSDLAQAQKELNANLPQAIDGFNQGLSNLPDAIKDAQNGIGSSLKANPSGGFPGVKAPSYSNISNSSSYFKKGGLEI